MATRRHFSAQEKLDILRRHLLEGVPVSDLCDEHQLNPNLLYRWHKQLFEGGAAAFERDGKPQERSFERKLAALQDKLAGKDEVIAEIIGYVRYWSDTAGLPRSALIEWLGVGRSKFYAWTSRCGEPNAHNAPVPGWLWLEPGQREAIARLHCGVLDGLSRYVVHWEIRERMTERHVESILARAAEQFPDARPRIISDNGPQFIARDFKAFIRLCGMTHVRTSPFYPQSNGKYERFNRSLKCECIRPKTPPYPWRMPAGSWRTSSPTTTRCASTAPSTT